MAKTDTAKEIVFAASLYSGRPFKIFAVLFVKTGKMLAPTCGKDPLL